MPFKSDKQRKACFATNGFHGKIDCHEWAKKEDGGTISMYRNKKMQRAGLFYEQQQREEEKKQQQYLQSLMGSKVISEDSITTPTPDPMTEKPTAPINPIQEGIDKGIIEGHKDYDSAQEWYDHMTKKPTYKDPSTPRNWQQKLGIGMMGIRTLLSEVGGRIARGRQNQYDYMQQTALGQMNPIPSSLFNQPGDTENLYSQEGGIINPYSQYAKYGGSLKKHQMGGLPLIDMDNIRKAKFDKFGNPVKMKFYRNQQQNMMPMQETTFEDLNNPGNYFNNEQQPIDLFGNLLAPNMKYGGLTHAKYFGPAFSNGATFKFSEEEQYPRQIANRVARKLFRKMGF